MSSKHILLVEDNEDDALLTLRAFKKNGIVNTVKVVKDGAEAIEYLMGPDSDALFEKRENPTIILLDLKLPKIDGLEVLKRIRSNERTKLIPVIILTSSNEETDLFTSYSLGCNSYIRKPVDFNNFINAVQQLGLYWLLMNETPPLSGE